MAIHMQKSHHCHHLKSLIWRTNKKKGEVGGGEEDKEGKKKKEMEKKTAFIISLFISSLKQLSDSSQV